MKKLFKWQKLKLKGEKGFTLMEILVAISLSLLLLGSLYGIYITSYKSYRNNIGKAELNQNARIALERISRDLRQGERITTPLPPNGTDALNPPPSQIQFQDGHVTDRIQYIKYLLSNNELIRQQIHYCFSLNCPEPDWVAWNAQDQYGNTPTEIIVPPGGQVKADKITSIKFYGVKVITVEVVASDVNGSYTYKTEALGRNIQ